MAFRQGVLRTILGFSLIGIVATLCAPFFFYFIAPSLFNGVAAFGLKISIAGFPFVSTILNFYLQMGMITLGGVSAALAGGLLGFGLAGIIGGGFYSRLAIGFLAGVGLPLYMLGFYAAIVLPLMSLTIIGLSTLTTLIFAYRFIFPEVVPLAAREVDSISPQARILSSAMRDFVNSFKAAPAAQEDAAEQQVAQTPAEATVVTLLSAFKTFATIVQMHEVIPPNRDQNANAPSPPPP